MKQVAWLLLPLGVVASETRLHAQCPDGSAPPCQAQPPRAPVPVPNSVAVLYFDNLSGDTADAYLAEGLTEELIAHLGRIERLVVKSRNAVRRYRAAELDPAQLGRALGVAHLVSGSVRRSGTRLRVSVELVRATTGVRLWGEQYDRAQADLLDLQEGIARAVAGVIAGRLLPAERATLAARPTRSPEAYDYFVKGNYYLAQRTARSTKQAVDQYRAALRLDPGFTRALARIAYAHAQTLYWGSFPEDVPADSVLARGLAAADGALRQDSTSSDAWMARAFLLSYRYPRAPVMAREAIERAVALDPRNAEAHHQYGTFLTNHGEYAAAVGQYQQALTIDPQRGTTLTGLGMVSLRRREYTAARAWLDSSLAVDPGFYPGYVRRAEARLLLGDTAAARSDAETATRLSAGDPLLGEAVLALVEARAGDTLSARARVGRLLREVALLEQRVRGGAVLARGSGTSCNTRSSMPCARTPGSYGSLTSRGRDDGRTGGQRSRIAATVSPPAPRSPTPASTASPGRRPGRTPRTRSAPRAPRPSQPRSGWPSSR